MTKKFLIAISLILCVVICPAFFPIQNQDRQDGPIVLVGGGNVPNEAVRWFKDRVKKGGYIVITYDFDYSSRWINLLNSLDIRFVLPERFEKVDLTKIGGIIIDGGDQWKYVNRLNGEAIQKAHEIGIPILGTSAGAMILGEHYFTAEKGSIGSDEIDQVEKICLGKKFVTIRHLEGTLVDTHYTERNRQKRLSVFIERSGANYGLGIDEHTALCIDERKFQVFGPGQVEIISPNMATR